MLDQTEAEAFIEQYEKLRDTCYELARLDGGKRMGDAAWLRNALCSSDMQLEARVNGIGCWGHTFTSQTQSSEYFEFEITYADIANADELLRPMREERAARQLARRG